MANNHNNTYSLALALHLVMISIDLAFNTASTLFYQQNQTQLLLFMLQDTAIVLSIIVMAIMFSSTFVFQAGLIGLLLRRFSAAIVVAFTYLALSILVHTLSLKERWGAEHRFVWPTHLVYLYTAQRIVAILHYFLYKRTILYLCQPKWHGDSDWLREKISQRG